MEMLLRILFISLPHRHHGLFQTASGVTTHAANHSHASLAPQVSGRRRNRGAPKTCGGVGTGKRGGRARRRQPGKRNELPRTRRKSTTAMQEILRSNTYTMHRDPPNPRPALPYHPQLPVFGTPTRNTPVSVRIDRQSPCSAKSRSYRISRALFCFPPCLIFGVVIHLPCALQMVTVDSAGKSTLSSPLCSAALLPLLPT
ncbi:uncharacterized protein BDZ83DRAFT_632678 [Colletotrichum acutatum]|uniref:Uncharacterized protein n=1 Tax=Glomerella acutata TaxID=27357 RepID=A0AAD8UBS7_GLOAC|nr:uncharacterized protein BDZ83DRAFT_632678 [Colletotrichum acutatum]KAK1718757.1 hypothetical protein BDZ83DRAFT_632678 [Colletotrichum acutatum]